MWQSETLWVLGTFFLCFYGYHLVYFYLSRRRPQQTRKGRLRQAVASAFARSITAGNYLLVVHQLRNVIMAVTFLASASVLLLGFVISFSGVWESLIEFPAYLRAQHYPNWVIILTLGVSFFSFLLALRHFNTLSFLISAEAQTLQEMEGTDHLAYLTDLFMRGSDAYTLGRRGFIYSVVVTLWYLNAWVFMAATVLLTIGVALFDR